jgi:hypothetical protein
MLVPMIGLVQVGSQARADRYTYLPEIGLYILATWSAMELFARWRRGREAVGCGCLGHNNSAGGAQLFPDFLLV